MSNTIQIACPHCGQQMNVSTVMAGRTAQCPGCTQAFTIPAAPQPPEAVIVRSPVATPAPPVSSVTPATERFERPVQQSAPLNTGLQPRSYLGVASMIFGVTALPFALLWAFLMGSMPDSSFGEMLPVAIPAGLAFGFFMGLILAIFMRGDTITVPFQNAQEFVSRINVAMSQIGYNPATSAADFLTFKPSFQAGFLSGRMSVVLQGNRATVVGPAMYVKKLARSLG
jgi:hypothetical protein